MQMHETPTTAREQRRQHQRWLPTVVTLAFTAVLGSSGSASAQDVKGAAQIIEFFRPSGLVPALFFVLVAALVLWLINRTVARLGQRFTERRLLAQQISTVLRFMIYIVTFIAVIRSVFRLDKQTIFALTGTIAVTVGFALKDLAASVLAGITILFDRPFQVGDRVTFGSVYGEIQSIGLRSVRLVTLDDSLVTIPNNKFLTDVVISGNAGELTMQIVMDYYIAQDADVARAKRIVSEAVRTSRFVFLAKPVVVLVNEVIEKSYLATRLRAKSYVLDVRYEKAFETDVTERVKAGFAAAGIRPPAVFHRGGDSEVEPSPRAA
jgi:small-conductance mechanosensitive channel